MREMTGRRYEETEDPVKILDQRLAAGEIDWEDHERLKRLVTRTSAGSRGPGRTLSTSWLTILIVLVVVLAVAVTSMALTYGPWRMPGVGTPSAGNGWPGGCCSWGGQGGDMGPGMGGGMGDVGVTDIAIAGYAYSPSEVRVPVGTTVTWVNMDGVMHTVSFGAHGDDHQGGAAMDSGPMYHMGVWSLTFDEPGTYEYHCDPHPYMTGTVIVEG